MELSKSTVTTRPRKWKAQELDNQVAPSTAGDSPLLGTIIVLIFVAL